MNNSTHAAHPCRGEGTIEKRLKTRCRNVTEDLYSNLLLMALDRIPRLQHGVVYKAQDIFGHEFWSDLKENSYRRLVGEVLAHFVARRMVPLRLVSCQYCTTKRYTRL